MTARFTFHGNLCTKVGAWVQPSIHALPPTRLLTKCVLKAKQSALVQDVIFSFPVKCKGGKWEIVQGLPIDEFSNAKLKATGRQTHEHDRLCTMQQHCGVRVYVHECYTCRLRHLPKSCAGRSLFVHPTLFGCYGKGTCTMHCNCTVIRRTKAEGQG